MKKSSSVQIWHFINYSSKTKLMCFYVVVFSFTWHTHLTDCYDAVAR